jgi:hypothetical protein
MANVRHKAVRDSSIAAGTLMQIGQHGVLELAGPGTAQREHVPALLDLVQKISLVFT